eukprot:XP_011682949.1 PREDICTED: uncharacterized protein LOC105447047 [Strongylocentrotus purpuratus]
MPVSLGEWRVRIGTFMRRRRKEYDYHYFWRKLHNLMKKAKNAEPPKENNNPECNISSRTGSSPDANRSPSYKARQSASSAQTGSRRDVNNGNEDKEETSDSVPSGKEDQSSDLSPKHRLDTTNNTDPRTSSIMEVKEYHDSPIYPVLGSGTTSGEADETKGNDCPDMTNILLLRSGDVEQNPGPNDKPGNLTDLELYLLADSMDPSDFRKVGLALGFTEAELSRFEKDQMGNTLYATYKMLYEWRKRVRDSEAREALVVTLQRIKLVQLADSVQKGQVGDHIPSLTEEEIQRVAEEVKDYMAIYLCQIQADPLNSELVLEFKRIFTNLTLMEEDKGTKRKTPLLYDDLLRTKVNERFPKRLLVEGEGGVGKTTFCAKIAWDWINGKGYQDFKLVLVILLRKTEGKTLGEIVKSYLSDNNPVTAKQLDKHILSNPDDVFLVLDGLDELAVDLDSNQQIALITLNRLFKSGTVLITSRQWRSDEIRKNADLRKVFAFIAVEGFSAENLSSYITKFFDPDTASSEDLNRFISNNDVIRGNMAPYPIYTAMLCIMWKEFDGERREAMSKLQTFSQLFNQMIDFLVDHHLSKHIPSSGIVEGKLGEHCSDIRPHLIHIGRIAFQGLLERRLVFIEEEFQSYPESIDVGYFRKVGLALEFTEAELSRFEKDQMGNTLYAIYKMLYEWRKRVRDSEAREALVVTLQQIKLVQLADSVQKGAELYQEMKTPGDLRRICSSMVTLLDGSTVDHDSNRNEYDMLIANITREALPYRYLLYFTSAQQKEVGLDIISRLIEAKTKRTQGRIDDDFIVDVAYESQDQAVAKAVADHLSTTSRKTLKIFTRMQAHTVSGHTFILNHREVDDLIIEKPCGRTASEDLAEFMCSSRSLRSVTIDLTRVTGTMHDFYSVLANKAVDSKIETLNIHSGDLSECPSASRDLAQFICKMTDLKKLKLGGHERPSASRDLAQFIYKIAHLKDLTLGGQYHDDFYSTSLSMATSAKVSI